MRTVQRQTRNGVMDISPASCFESGKYGVQLYCNKGYLLSFVAFLTPDTHSQWPTVPQNKPRNLLLTTALHSLSHTIFQGLSIKSANRRSLNIPTSNSNLVSNELMFNFCAEAGTIPVSRIIIINIRCYKLPTFGQYGFNLGVLLKWRDTFWAVSCFVFHRCIHYLLLMAGLNSCTPPTRLRGSVQFQVIKYVLPYSTDDSKVLNGQHVVLCTLSLH